MKALKRAIRKKLGTGTPALPASQAGPIPLKRRGKPLKKAKAAKPAGRGY